MKANTMFAAAFLMLSFGCLPLSFICFLTMGMKSHTPPKRIYLGGASCPWKVKQCPLCESEERRKTIVSKLLGLGSSLLDLRGDVR